MPIESHHTGTRKYIAITISVMLSSVLVLIPLIKPDLMETGFMSDEAIRLTAIFLLILTLWLTEILPMAITALLAIVLQPLFGVTEAREAFASFVSPVFFFVIAMYMVAAVINETGLDKRFALFLLLRSGTRSTHILFVLMLGTAVLSSIMSDIPACAIFMAIGLSLLEKTNIQPGQSNFAKNLMMGIPIAALIGGIATPAGSSINVLALDLLAVFSEQHGLNISITFIQWMTLGIPMVIVLLPFSWWVLLKCYPPELETIGTSQERESDYKELGALTRNEIKVLLIVLLMIVLWIVGSWVEVLNVTVVALFGAIILFMPGIKLISWKKAERHIGWETLIMIGGISSLGHASVKTGLAEWLVHSTMGGLAHWPILWLIPIISLITVLIHLPLPIAPVVNAVLIPPVAALALAMNINPIILVLPVAFTASCAFLLPLDAVPLLTFSKGYYRMFDMLLPGAIISLAWVLLMTVVMIWIAPITLSTLY